MWFQNRDSRSDCEKYQVKDVVQRAEVVGIAATHHREQGKQKNEKNRKKTELLDGLMKTYYFGIPF